MTSYSTSELGHWLARNLNAQAKTVVVGTCNCSPARESYADLNGLPERLTFRCEQRQHAFGHITLLDTLSRLNNRRTSKDRLRATIVAVLGLCTDLDELQEANNLPRRAGPETLRQYRTRSNLEAFSTPTADLIARLEPTLAEVPVATIAADRRDNHSELTHVAANTETSLVLANGPPLLDAVIMAPHGNAEVVGYEQDAAAMGGVLGLARFVLTYGIPAWVHGPAVYDAWQRGDAAALVRYLLPFMALVPGGGGWLAAAAQTGGAMLVLAPALRRTRGDIGLPGVHTVRETRLNRTLALPDDSVAAREALEALRAALQASRLQKDC